MKPGFVKNMLYVLTGFQRDTLFESLYTANNSEIFLSIIYLIVQDYIYRHLGRCIIKTDYHRHINTNISLYKQF